MITEGIFFYMRREHAGERESQLSEIEKFSVRTIMPLISIHWQPYYCNKAMTRAFNHCTFSFCLQSSLKSDFEIMFSSYKGFIL